SRSRQSSWLHSYRKRRIKSKATDESTPMDTNPYPTRHERPGTRHSPAFTLIELLAVIAVIGVLAALMLPAVSTAKSYAQRTHCLSNLKQLQVAWLNYAHDNNDRLVPNKSRNDPLIQRSVAPS